MRVPEGQGLAVQPRGPIPVRWETKVGLYQPSRVQRASGVVGGRCWERYGVGLGLVGIHSHFWWHVGTVSMHCLAMSSTKRGRDKVTGTCGWRGGPPGSTLALWPPAACH